MRVPSPVAKRTTHAVYINIVGGPLHGAKIQTIMPEGQRRPDLRKTHKVKVDGVMAIYVYNPVDDLWVCRYEEELGE
jgi:hypothetical protein